MMCQPSRSDNKQLIMFLIMIVLSVSMPPIIARIAKSKFFLNSLRRLSTSML